MCEWIIVNLTFLSVRQINKKLTVLLDEKKLLFYLEREKCERGRKTKKRISNSQNSIHYVF